MFDRPPFQPCRVPMAVTVAVTAIEIRPIPGAPGYFATSAGTIRGPRGGTLKTWGRGGPGGQDYLAVEVRGRQRYVHVLVCLAFHGPKPWQHWVVSHLDEDKANNRPGNLVWASQVTNMRHWAARRSQPSTEEFGGRPRAAGDIF